MIHSDHHHPRQQLQLEDIGNCWYHPTGKMTSIQVCIVAMSFKQQHKRMTGIARSPYLTQSFHWKFSWFLFFQWSGRTYFVPTFYLKFKWWRWIKLIVLTPFQILIYHPLLYPPGSLQFWLILSRGSIRNWQCFTNHVSFHLR